MEAFIALGAIATAILAILGVIAYGPKIAAALRWVWLHTLGRRGALYQRLSRLSAGVQLEYFIDQLGLPVAFKQQGATTVRGPTSTYTFVHPWFYVMVLVDGNSTVLLYTVTSRDEKFQPQIWPNKLHPQTRPQPENRKLGTFTFAELAHAPTAVIGGVGANRFGYTEAFYSGGPWNYQTLVLGLNDAGWIEAGTTRCLLEAMPDYGVALGGFAKREDAVTGSFTSIEGYLGDEGVNQFRSTAMPNTYGVTAPHFGAGSQGFDGWVGVDYGTVRTLLE